jgi:hypothetical protein
MHLGLVPEHFVSVRVSRHKSSARSNCEAGTRGWEPVMPTASSTSSACLVDRLSPRSGRLREGGRVMIRPFQPRDGHLGSGPRMALHRRCTLLEKQVSGRTWRFTRVEPGVGSWSGRQIVGQRQRWANACRGSASPSRRCVACDCTGSEHRDKALWQCMATGLA